MIGPQSQQASFPLVSQHRRLSRKDDTDVVGITGHNYPGPTQLLGINTPSKLGPCQPNHFLARRRLHISDLARGASLDAARSTWHRPDVGDSELNKPPPHWSPRGKDSSDGLRGEKNGLDRG